MRFFLSIFSRVRARLGSWIANVIGVPAKAKEADEWTDNLALERIEAISVNARTTWFGLLGLLAFVLVTLLGVEDIDFFGYGRETDLPLIGVSVPTTTFFVAAPILTTAVYAYFHFYLLKLWDALGRAPARIGREPLGDRIHPWLLSDAALLLREEEGAAPRRAMRYLSAITSAGLTWVFGWTVLGIAWWRSLPAHYEWLSLLIAACFFLAFWVGINSFVAAWRRIRLKAFDERYQLFWRTWPRIGAICLTVLFGFIFTWYRTEGDLVGYLAGTSTCGSNPALIADKSEIVIPEQQEFQAIFDNIETVKSDFKNASERSYSTLVIFETSCDDFMKGADLFEAQLTEKPADWLDHKTAEKIARRKWCDRRDMEWALCVKSPDDRQRALRRTWCADEKRSPDLLLSQCDSFFVHEEEDFQREWMAQRDDYLSVLKKPNLEGRDLRGAVLTGAFLPDVDLESARLEGADLSGARMGDAILHEARMEGANLSGAQARRADFSRARMESAILVGVEMERANLTEARMANIFAACAEKARSIGLCQPAQFESANLTGAWMQGAHLDGARMEGAVLSGAHMERADLRGARMAGADLRGAWMAGANLRGALMEGADLRGARMEGADLRGARMEGADLYRARMEGVELSEARMEGADLSEARMEGAKLSEARMEGAGLSGARLESADLSGAIIRTSPLGSADFTNARGLTQNQLSNAIGNAETILPADAETGAPLFVWSCWEEAPETLLGLLETYPEFMRDDIRSDWLCAEDETPRRTGRTECGVEVTEGNWNRPKLLACPPDDPRRSREP